MYVPRTDPKELVLLLPRFCGAQFIVKKGRGKDTEVYAGKIEKVEVQNLSEKKIAIYSHMVCQRRIGCNADFSEAERWTQVEFPSGTLAFEYNWFYEQRRHARLKLESVVHNDRCWLCSYTDPIHLELFRAMLMKMFVEESLKKESLWRRLRSRLFL